MSDPPKPVPCELSTAVPQREEQAAVNAGLLGRMFATGSKFAILEVLTQVVGLAAALVILRNTSKTEYAWYTLANNLQGTLGIFSVVGVGSGLLAMGGACLGNKLKMGQVVAAATSQRLLLFGIAAPLAVPFFASLLWKTACPPWQIACLVGAALVLFFLAIAEQMISVPLGLAGRYNISQTTAVLSGILRLIAVLLLLYTGHLYSFQLMLVSAATGAVGIFLRVPYSRHYVELVLHVPREIKRRFRRLVIVGLPSALTYVFEAQVAGLLLAWFGHASNVADLGALSRLGLLLAVPSAFITKIMTPRLAAERILPRLRGLWSACVGLSFLVAIGFFAGIFFLRKPALWVLGPQYAKLETELVLYAGFLSFSFFVSGSCAIVSARAWARHSWFRPIVVFGCQACAASLFSPATVRGAIMVMVAGSVGHALVEAFLIINGFRGKGEV